MRYPAPACLEDVTSAQLVLNHRWAAVAADAVVVNDGRASRHVLARTHGVLKGVETDAASVLMERRRRVDIAKLVEA